MSTKCITLQVKLKKKSCLSNALEVNSFLQLEMKFPFDVCIAPQNEVYVKFTQINAQTVSCQFIGGHSYVKSE